MLSENLTETDIEGILRKGNVFPTLLIQFLRILTIYVLLHINIVHIQNTLTNARILHVAHAITITHNLMFLQHTSCLQSGLINNV
jgi:hypothetical protein